MRERLAVCWPTSFITFSLGDWHHGSEGIAQAMFTPDEMLADTFRFERDQVRSLRLKLLPVLLNAYGRSEKERTRGRIYLHLERLQRMPWVSGRRHALGASAAAHCHADRREGVYGETPWQASRDVSPLTRHERRMAAAARQELSRATDHVRTLPDGVGGGNAG